MLTDLGWEYVEYKDEDAYFADAMIPIDEIIICKLPGHLVAVIKGVAHDTWNIVKSKKPKKLMGYWVKSREKV